MRPLLTQRSVYSRAEYVSDLAVHMIGLVAVVGCVPVLIVLAAVLGDGPSHVVATVVYGVSFAVMISCSALYNIVLRPEWEWLLKRLDHTAIYLKIAGTVTGFALIAGQGWVLVSALWATAALGVSLKLAAPFRFQKLGIALYLSMGWAAGLLGWGIFAALPGSVLVLIILGGLSYTVGVGFYVWDRLPFHFTIWHALVLVGSLCLYAALVIAIVN